jgi:peptide deformylase
VPLEELVRSGTECPIVRWGNPPLHHPCRAVTEFGPDLWSLLSDMFATNRAADGVGLAAPQIGVDLAVFVYDCLDGFGRRRQGLVCNPRLALLADPPMSTEFEGCLSLPGAFMPLARPDVSVVRGEDQFGEPIRVAGTGLLARCLQHETDHTNGVVMEDHLTASERRDLRRQHNGVATHFPDNWPA